MRRKVARSISDPSDNKRRIYMLDCGHHVSRRGASDKRWCECLTCDVDIADKSPALGAR
jgi:hypothetical protein